MGQFFKLHKSGVLLVLGTGKVKFFGPSQIAEIEKICEEWHRTTFLNLTEFEKSLYEREKNGIKRS